jgi:hypothetical protein
MMSRKIESGLKFYLKWSYYEPEHPRETMTEWTWETGIEYTISGPKLKFDENTSLSQWKKSEIDRWELLMKNFKKDQKLPKLDSEINPSLDKIKEIELDKDFIKWVD